MAHVGADDSFQVLIAKSGSLGIIVKHGAGEIQMAADVSSIVTIRGIDRLVGGATKGVAPQKSLDEIDSCLAVRRLGSVVPVSVPDDVNGNRTTFQHWTAMIVDAVALYDRLSDGAGSRQGLAGLAMLPIRRLVFTRANALGDQGIDYQKHEDKNQKVPDLSKGKSHADLTRVEFTEFCWKDRTDNADVGKAGHWT